KFVRRTNQPAIYTINNYFIVSPRRSPRDNRHAKSVGFEYDIRKTFIVRSQQEAIGLRNVTEWSWNGSGQFNLGSQGYICYDGFQPRPHHTFADDLIGKRKVAIPQCTQDAIVSLFFS